MRHGKATLMGFVLVWMLAGLAGVAWGQDVGRAEVGGDGECTDEECETEGGGRDDDIRSLETSSFYFPIEGDDDMDTILANLGAGLEYLMTDLGCTTDCDSEPWGNGLDFNASEVGTICLRESGDALDMVGVAHPGDNFIAKIRKVTDLAKGGGISILLKPGTGLMASGFIYVPTELDQPAYEVNNAIENALLAKGYTVDSRHSYFLITKAGEDIRQVKFWSLDPGIKIGEVALELIDSDSTLCDGGGV